MTLNHRFWEAYFEREFVPQLRAMVDVLEKRLLPAFAGIEQEAEKVSDDVWNAIMSSPGTGDEDLADFAEDAEQAGVSHYMLLDSIRQGMVNLFAAALYHTFEQQVMLFLRREILSQPEENDATLFHMSVFKKRLKAVGVDITKLSAWVKIDELRLLANTAKHADGDSAKELHQRRPDLFEHPQADFGRAFRSATPRVFQPLAGEDLYVALSDVQAYRDGLIRFWSELVEALRLASDAG